MNEYNMYTDEFEDHEFEDEDNDYDPMVDDICYECTGYGDDYVVNEDGELECVCDTCPFGSQKWGRGED